MLLRSIEAIDLTGTGNRASLCDGPQWNGLPFMVKQSPQFLTICDKGHHFLQVLEAQHPLKSIVIFPLPLWVLVWALKLGTPVPFSFLFPYPAFVYFVYFTVLYAWSVSLFSWWLTPFPRLCRMMFTSDSRTETILKGQKFTVPRERGAQRNNERVFCCSQGCPNRLSKHQWERS